MGAERRIVMNGFVQDIESLAVKEQRVSPGSLHGEALPARCHGVKA
jgi:hypothetical protein